MQSGEFSDEDFVRALAASGARVLLIGRRALILLGAPVMTADYDVWLHFDDIERFNAAFEALDHVASRSPEEGRRLGRYVIENGERIDVLVARSASTPDGTRLDFEAAWSRRRAIEIAVGLEVHIPCLDDLITTKRCSSRPKDVTDIQYLEAIRREERQE